MKQVTAMKFTFAPESRPLEGYTIKRAIHRGGFGEVYYAVSDAGREVALKLLQNNAEIELRGVEQCLNLSHPNLVTIFDIRKDGDDDQWIIMEFVSGDPLDQVIRKHPNGMPVELVRKWLPGLAAGVTYLHSRGIVHRDLKPANVFSEDGIVKIGDVGLSKFIAPSRRSAQTQSVGTVYYMAPEVAKGRYGREVDVYALGIILFEMLTGTVPFDGESQGEILMKHLSESPDLSALPPRMRGVIAKSLEKEPQKRFNSAAAFERALTDAILGRGEPIKLVDDDFIVEDVKATPPPLDKTAHFDEPIEVLLAEDEVHSHRQPVNRVTNKRNAPSAKTRKGSGQWGVFAIVIAAILTINFFGVGFGYLGFGEIVILSVLGLVAWPFIRNRFDRHREPKAATLVSAPAKKTPPPLPRPFPTKNSPGIGPLLGAGFVAVPFTAILTAGLALMKPSLFQTGASELFVDPSSIGMVSIVTIISSWAIMLVPHIGNAFGSRWKSSRLSFAMAGIVVGLMAAFLDQYLLFSNFIPSGWGESFNDNSAIFASVGDWPLYASGGPTVAGYMAFFTAFFGLRTWFSEVNPNRPKRISIKQIFVSILVAWLASMIFAFPHILALVWGLLISCVVQLSSPWQPLPKHLRG